MVPTVERGVVRGGFLLDRNRRRKAFDVIDVRLVHDGKELARVGRERLDVAPLSLGVDGIEGERGFAAAGEAGDDDHAVARQVEVDIFRLWVRAREWRWFPWEFRVKKRL